MPTGRLAGGRPLGLVRVSPANEDDKRAAMLGPPPLPTAAAGSGGVGDRPSPSVVGAVEGMNAGPGCAPDGLLVSGAGAGPESDESEPNAEVGPDDPAAAGFDADAAGFEPDEPEPGPSAGDRAEDAPEPLTTGVPSGLCGLAGAGAASAAAAPLAALPFAEPVSLEPAAAVVPAVGWSADGDAASAGFWPVAAPSEPSPGAHEGACTRLSTPSSSAPLSDTRLSPVSTV